MGYRGAVCCRLKRRCVTWSLCGIVTCVVGCRGVTVGRKRLGKVFAAILLVSSCECGSTCVDGEAVGHVKRRYG
jgi:hypothetical protein